MGVEAERVEYIVHYVFLFSTLYTGGVYNYP
jgi:hypothetical protein